MPEVHADVLESGKKSALELALELGVRRYLAQVEGAAEREEGGRVDLGLKLASYFVNARR